MTASARRVAILPDAVADQIAAGEVVERPASVVKELTENALDAGATHIRIAIENGGKTVIEVSDNGTGMGRDDAILAVDRHATSKIRSAGDLVGVTTFGFRGEALPAIASVARFTLVTAVGPRVPRGRSPRPGCRPLAAVSVLSSRTTSSPRREVLLPTVRAALAPSTVTLSSSMRYELTAMGSSSYQGLR